MASPGSLFFKVVFFVIFNRLLLEILVYSRESLILNVFSSFFSTQSCENQLYFCAGLSAPLCMRIQKKAQLEPIYRDGKLQFQCLNSFFPLLCHRMKEDPVSACNVCTLMVDYVASKPEVSWCKYITRTCFCRWD